MSTQSITDSYGHDHDRLDGLFQQYRKWKRTDYPTAADSFRQFKRGLERHIAWEEEILFPQFEAKTGMRGTGPTEAMRFEHRQIKHRLGQIVAKLHQGDPETDVEEAALFELLSAHNQKEEAILYPACDEFLDEAEHRAVFERMETIQAPGCCCCHGAHEQETQDAIVDVRPLPPPQRHRLIFQTFDSLKPGGAFVLVNDHDPKPLYYQFAAEYSGRFDWTYLEQGPEAWRVRVGRTA
jgi:uncharacterized protein (DUF2249 family)/hemerythrin-like domain-containing protein